jgi:hypothetical protein
MPEKEAYLYLGHARDMCDKDGKPILKIVPPGNLYITVGICGLSTYWHTEDLVKAFIDPKNKDIWSNPDRLSLQRILKNITDTTTIHIHKPGDTYVDNIYLPLNEFKFKDTKQVNDKNYNTLKLELSGMLPLSKAPALFEKGIPETKTFLSSANGIQIPVNEFDELFQYSIWPIVEHPENTKILRPENLLNITKYYSNRMSFSLNEFPGIHYNFLCRVVNPYCTKASLLRRRQSAVLFQTQPETLAKTIGRNTSETREEFKTIYGKQTNWNTGMLFRQARTKLLDLAETQNLSKDLTEFETFLDTLPPEEAPEILQKLVRIMTPETNSPVPPIVRELVVRKQEERKQKNINLAESERRKLFFELQAAEKEKEYRIIDLEYYIEQLQKALEDCKKRRKNLTKKIRKRYGRGKTPKVR